MSYYFVEYRHSASQPLIAATRALERLRLQSRSMLILPQLRTVALLILDCCKQLHDDSGLSPFYSCICNGNVLHAVLTVFHYVFNHGQVFFANLPVDSATPLVAGVHVVISGTHWEYHSFLSRHSAPSQQQLGPSQSFPPHCPHPSEQPPSMGRHCQRRNRERGAQR